MTNVGMKKNTVNHKRAKVMSKMTMLECIAVLVVKMSQLGIEVKGVKDRMNTLNLAFQFKAHWWGLSTRWHTVVSLDFDMQRSPVLLQPQIMLLPSGGPGGGGFFDLDYQAY